MFTYQTAAPEETVRFGKKLGELLKPGMVLLLSGDLGAGKTCMAGGILSSLGVVEHVTSPTYTLVNEYAGKFAVAHFDLYRLERPEELFDIGFEEYLDGRRVVLIEWPERGGAYLPNEFLRVAITGREQAREIRLEPVGAEYEGLVEEMKDFVSTRN